MEELQELCRALAKGLHLGPPVLYLSLGGCADPEGLSLGEQKGTLWQGFISPFCGKSSINSPGTPGSSAVAGGCGLAQTVQRGIVP